MERRRPIKSEDTFIWDYNPGTAPATAKSFYLDNKNKIDELIASIKWAQEDPKSDHGYYSGIDIASSGNPSHLRQFSPHLAP